MPRRARIVKREVMPDPVYRSRTVAKFINKVMVVGKKGLAERTLYDAFEIMQRQTKRDPLEVFEQALRNATPLLEVKPRRVGGATYQVPVEVDATRGKSLAIRWLIKSTRSRGGKSMAEKFAAELIEASKNQGATVKKREDTHKMAEANRAFAHYRW
jgi:small subunit ribosomal protein S7